MIRYKEQCFHTLTARGLDRCLRVEWLEHPHEHLHCNFTSFLPFVQLTDSGPLCPLPSCLWTLDQLQTYLPSSGATVDNSASPWLKWQESCPADISGGALCPGCQETPCELLGSLLRTCIRMCSLETYHQSLLWSLLTSFIFGDLTEDLLINNYSSCFSHNKMMLVCVCGGDLHIL